jgi:hypothetical protein
MAEHCYAECLYAECLYDECFMLNVSMLNVLMLNVFMLNVFMLNVFMLNVFMLNVFMLNVIMLSVVTPSFSILMCFWCKIAKTNWACKRLQNFNIIFWKNNAFSLDNCATESDMQMFLFSKCKCPFRLSWLPRIIWTLSLFVCYHLLIASNAQYYTTFISVHNTSFSS